MTSTVGASSPTILPTSPSPKLSLLRLSSWRCLRCQIVSYHSNIMWFQASHSVQLVIGADWGFAYAQRWLGPSLLSRSLERLVSAGNFNQSPVTPLSNSGNGGIFKSGSRLETLKFPLIWLYLAALPTYAKFPVLHNRWYPAIGRGCE